MASYNNIAEGYVRTLAYKSGVKSRGRQKDEIVNDLKAKGSTYELDYLDKQFQFAGSATGLTICRPDHDFPHKSKTAEDFINMLVQEKHIKKDQIGEEWRVGFSPDIQICCVVQDGSDVFIKLVEGKQSTLNGWYSKQQNNYPHFTSLVIHFGPGLIELRCAHSYRDTFVEYIMKLMGFAQPYKWHSWTMVTKEQAKRISSLLQANLVSTEILLPSTVGSIRFTADRSDKNKKVNLRNDPTLGAIVDKMNELDLPTDDTNDEVCDFDFTDPVTGIEFPVSFEINIKKGGFKFLKPVTEAIINHVLDAFIKVIASNKVNEAMQEIASSNEESEEVQDAASSSSVT